ncbi:MAG TPA: SpoIIE family protein phosphatase [Herpetosiphonaceae bacterium]
MLDIGVAERPKAGATVSGDSYLVKSNGSTELVAVIDGLGGGTAAAEAAKKAYDAIEANADRPLSTIMQAAHHACQGTRGAVVGLLRLDHQKREATYVGVGNIGIYVVSKHVIKPLSRNGIVGYRMPSLMEQKATYDAGDTFILFSDGISMRFTEAPLMHEGLAPQPLADRILEAFGKTIDDVTIVVAKTPQTAPQTTP